MKNILDVWKQNNYLQPLLEITLIIALIISIRNNKTIKSLRFLPYYLASFLLLMLNTYAYYLIFQNTSLEQLSASIDRYGNYIVTIIEFITFSYYLYSISKSSQLRKIILIIFFLTTSILSFYLIEIFKLDKLKGMNLLNDIYVVQSTGLLLMSGLSVTTSKTIAIKKHHFAIPTALSIYLITTLPYTIYISLNDSFINNIDLYKCLFSITYGAYIFLFVIIIRIYKEKYKITYQSL